MTCHLKSFGILVSPAADAASLTWTCWRKQRVLLSFRRKAKGPSHHGEQSRKGRIVVSDKPHHHHLDFWFLKCRLGISRSFCSPSDIFVFSVENLPFLFSQKNKYQKVFTIYRYQFTPTLCAAEQSIWKKIEKENNMKKLVGFHLQMFLWICSFVL